MTGGIHQLYTDCDKFKMRNIQSSQKKAERVEQRNKSQVEQIESKQQNGKLKSFLINSYIKCKCSKHANKNRGCQNLKIKQDTMKC